MGGNFCLFLVYNFGLKHNGYNVEPIPELTTEKSFTFYALQFVFVFVHCVALVEPDVRCFKL